MRLTAVEQTVEDVEEAILNIVIDFAAEPPVFDFADFDSEPLSCSELDFSWSMQLPAVFGADS